MQYNRNFFFNNNENKDFDQIAISIASPEKILSLSYGEVTKPETINYRTFKPEKDGLFCSRIFGPVRDYECLCGKYKRMKYRNLICEKCGVEVTLSRVRRERMGHITLASPAAHIWFVKSLPSRIGSLLDISLRDLESILYCESYVVVDPGISSLHYGEILREDDYNKNADAYDNDGIVVSIGAEAIKSLLQNLDLKDLSVKLRAELAITTSELKKKKIIRKLRIIQAFLKSKNKPEWMIMSVIPILPPELRPLVMLDGGRFASSDLNDLYRRLINRNNRLAKLKELNAPDIIIKNEKRMLQEAVDALFDNSRRSRVIRNFNKRPLKSLSDILKGKQGRFRQNLLGKRVDYSGRSVIVVGPTLKLDQCGIPKKMALELFKPFVYAKLEIYGIAATIKAAKMMVSNEKPEVWDILDEVIKSHPVLLNRAPTLHRLSIQAFEPILIEGKAIQLHPLVCAAFNADFDGDQMAVHVPLSIEAQLESRILMMASNNILSPASGRPIIVPSKDIVLGIYYLSIENKNGLGAGMIFANTSELEHALHNKIIHIHSPIKIRHKITNDKGQRVTTIISTTPGRILISQILPINSNVPFSHINKTITVKEINSLIETIHCYCTKQETIEVSEKIMDLGFKYATQSGISFNKDDIVIPPTKEMHILESKKIINKFESQYQEGLITSNEKYNKAIDTWTRCSNKIADDMMKCMAGNSYNSTNTKEIEESDVDIYKIPGCRYLNSIYMMAYSGTRGSPAQLKQLAGMRGLMSKPSGEIIEQPILSNFREGLNVLEYFNSTHGARKGLSDTALKTANSGYLTRRLVDVAQDFVAMQEDCGSEDGIIAKEIIDGEETIISIEDLVLGRTTTADIHNPINNEIIIPKNTIINLEHLKQLKICGISEMKIRSALTCKLRRGICIKCYGTDLSTGMPVAIGTAVGIIAAQSIGEPGTQLTMRTFHIGGAATSKIKQSGVESIANDLTIHFSNQNIMTCHNNNSIVTSRSFSVSLQNKIGNEVANYAIPYGARLYVKDQDTLKKDQKIADWDPHTTPIITEKSGIIFYKDLIENVSVDEVSDDTTGIINKIVIDWKKHPKGSDLHPQLILQDKNGKDIKLANGLDARYATPVGSMLNVKNGQQVNSGDVIIRIPHQSSKTRDITGGLVRVIELFEARHPQDHSVICEKSGVVKFGKNHKTKQRILIEPHDKSEPIEYLIPKGKYTLINEGANVSKGDLLIDGIPDPHNVLAIMGQKDLAEYMINEIQNVYKLQGVKINNKHIEVVLSQMLRKYEIISSGDSMLLAGEQIENDELSDIIAKCLAEGKKPPQTKPILQGITKASLHTKSFIAAASFQETTKVLTEAAISGKVDKLQGLKESVLVGKLIPAGTGFYKHSLKSKYNKKTKDIKN